MSDRKLIAERIKQERHRLKMSQTEFAALAGASYQTQGNYERGSRVPDVDYLNKLGNKGVDVGYILTGIPTPAPGHLAEEPDTYGMSDAEKKSYYMDMVIDVQSGMKLNLTAGQLKILIGYACQHAPTRASLRAFIENAIAFSSEGFTKK